MDPTFDLARHDFRVTMVMVSELDELRNQQWLILH